MTETRKKSVLLETVVSGTRRMSGNVGIRDLPTYVVFESFTDDLLTKSAASGRKHCVTMTGMIHP